MTVTKIKPLYLLDILHKHTDSEHRLTADELCSLLNSEYGVSAERKGIYRDLDVLTEYGADVQKTTQGYYLRKRRFMTAEVRLLISAVQSAAFITPDKTVMLIRKLMSYLSKYQAEAITRQANIGMVKYSNEEVYKTIEAVNLAISVRRKISFYYYKRGLNKKEIVQHDGKRYLVSPYAMIWVQDKYYLVCNVEGHDNLTHFRIDRMRGVYAEHLPWRHFREVSSFTSRFDAAEYASYCINMFGGSVRTVTLRCKTDKVNEVFEKFGDKIPVKQEDSECFTTVVDVAINEGFFGWVAQYFGSIEIVAPNSVRQEFKERMEKAYSLYV